MITAETIHWFALGVLFGIGITVTIVNIVLMLRD